MIENEDGSEIHGGWNGLSTDPGSVVRNRNDGETPVSVTVIETLAEAKGVSPIEIEQPLYEVVDPEALDDLFDGSDGATTAGQVVFSIDNYDVTVTARGDVSVCARE